MNSYYSTLRSLVNMVNEMEKKDLDLKRITKTSSLLMLCGLTPNSISTNIIDKVISQQSEDGGWISIVDTMWNTYFLTLLNPEKYSTNIESGKEYLLNNKNETGLWGRSLRDISRIPVSGILLYLFPELNIDNEIDKLELLWKSEINSIVYKAGYSLMALSKTNHTPNDLDLIKNTCSWLINNQREDGGFAPWIDHPVDSNVFCTATATLGLMQYPEFVPQPIFNKSFNWLISNRLKSGIWKYHEIEDGASWGLYTLYELERRGII